MKSCARRIHGCSGLTVNDLFEQPDDATPLTQRMRELMPRHIAYRRELNEAEQENIARAQDWALNAVVIR